MGEMEQTKTGRRDEEIAVIAKKEQTQRNEDEDKWRKPLNSTQEGAMGAEGDASCRYA